MKVRLVLKSGNTKTGQIPVSMTERASCPDSCSFKHNGCYAEGWPSVVHWDNVPRDGVDWIDFCVQVADLPAGQFWRHNSGGDLDGLGNEINVASLEQLTAANTGKRGFTYTHKPITLEAMRRGGATLETVRSNRAAVSNANLRGFTVNVSCDSLEELDALGDALPAVVVLPEPEPIPSPSDAALTPPKRRAKALARGIDAAPKKITTPEGRRVVVCPAQYKEAVTCESCQLCSRVTRSCAVGFWAHGFARRKVSNLVAPGRLTKGKDHATQDIAPV